MNPQLPIRPGEPALAREVMGHAIPDARVPLRPTLIRPLPQKPLQTESLEELARHIHQLRGGRGLRIGPLSRASYGGSDTFPGFSLYAIDPQTGGEDWIALAAVQSERDDALRAALRATDAEGGGERLVA